jgi:PAS domain S-box-containing protein
MPGQSLNRHSRQVLERITDGFYALDRDFRFTYINAAAERMVGQPRESLLGANLWEAFPPTIETPLYAAYHEAMATGQTITFEFYYPPLEHWIEVRVFPAPEGLSVFFRDISASRQLTETLRESESRYRSLIDHLPAIVYMVANDERQTPLYLSPRHEALTGYSNEETLGRTEHWLDLVHPDDRARVTAENERSETYGTAFRAEYRLQCKDGSYIWVLDEFVPVHDAAGQITAWQGVMLDVTERVHSDEQSLRLASIVNSSSEAIISTTLDGIITSWNPAAEQLYGYATADAIGQSVTMLTPPGKPGDVASLLAQVCQGESVTGYETERLTRDGRLLDVSLAISPVRDASGNIVALSTIARDITALRKAEAALRLRDRALAATTNGIIIIDATAPGNPIVDVNPAFEMLTGYSLDKAVGNSARILYGPGTDMAAAQRIRHAIQSGNDITETILTYRHDGTSFWAHHNVAAVRDPAGSLTHFVGVLTDVSERIRVEAALAQERDLLETLLEHLPDAVYIKDTDSRFLRLNQATARELGISTVEEAVGKTDRDFFPEALAAEYMSDERRLLTAGEALVNKPERQTVSSNGRWVLATKVPLRDANGGIVGLVGINRDITELQQHQEEMARLAAIVEFSQDAIIGVTLDGTITSWNSAAARLYGYTPSGAVGQSMAMLVPPGGLNDLPELLDRVARGDHVEGREGRHQARDGHILDTALTISPVVDSDGDVIGASIIARDVTELRRLQEERDRLYDELNAEFQRAAEVQALMLPHGAPEIAGYEFAGICLPARQVGGDFFDWSVEDKLVRLSLGDVMGKGMAAALQTATVRAALRAVTYLSVSEVVENVNRALFPDLIQSDSFITLFHANLDTTTGELTYIDAGHGMAFVQRQDGAVEPLRQHALPLGVLIDADYPLGSTTLEPGDTLVIYSDGLPDARPELPLDAVGVAGQIRDLPDAQSKLDQLVRLVSGIQSRPDDLTLVVLRRCQDVGMSAAPAVGAAVTSFTTGSVSR